MNSDEKRRELEFRELEMLLAQEESNLTELGVETLNRLKQELQYEAN
ncbi:hypothetical protein [Sutcliffiella halmapala]|nr:hypothetical protein [Sutcliffiella halmapala]